MPPALTPLNNLRFLQDPFVAIAKLDAYKSKVSTYDSWFRQCSRGLWGIDQNRTAWLLPFQLQNCDALKCYSDDLRDSIWSAYDTAMGKAALVGASYHTYKTCGAVHQI